VFSRGQSNWLEVLQEITGGRGVDIAVEALGKPATFNQAIMSVRDGGRAVMIGLAPFGVTSEVEISRLVRRQVLIFSHSDSFPPRTFSCVNWATT